MLPNGGPSMLSLHSLLLGGIVGYAMGSIPSAYLITKWRAGLDLRQWGTGNIGAMNAYDVTGKRSIGTLVFIADFLKGMLPVLAFELLGWSGPLVVLLPTLVLGHCYPVWLRFQGGRGLATTAGALILVHPAAVFLWLALYGLSKKFWDNVHGASVLACGGALLFLLLLPISFIQKTTLPISGLADSGLLVRASIGVMVLIILSRFLEPFLELLRRRTR